MSDDWWQQECKLERYREEMERKEKEEKEATEAPLRAGYAEAMKLKKRKRAPIVIDVTKDSEYRSLISKKKKLEESLETVKTALTMTETCQKQQKQIVERWAHGLTKVDKEWEEDQKGEYEKVPPNLYSLICDNVTELKWCGREHLDSGGSMRWRSYRYKGKLVLAQLYIDYGEIAIAGHGSHHGQGVKRGSYATVEEAWWPALRCFDVELGGDCERIV